MMLFHLRAERNRCPSPTNGTNLSSITSSLTFCCCCCCCFFLVSSSLSLLSSSSLSSSSSSSPIGTSVSTPFTSVIRVRTGFAVVAAADTLAPLAAIDVLLTFSFSRRPTPCLQQKLIKTETCLCIVGEKKLCAHRECRCRTRRR